MGRIPMGTGWLAVVGFMMLWTSWGCTVPPEGPPERQLEATKPNVESLVKMGDANLREGKFRQALKHYLQADQLAPQDPELKFRIALVFGEYYHRDQDAVRYYKEAISLRPKYSEAYNNLGMIYLRQKRWDEAIEMFNKALGNLFYTTPEKAYLGLARAYRGKGDAEMAVENYKRAIEQAPQFAPLKVDLGLYLMELGRYKEALDSLSRARLLMERNPPNRLKRPPEDVANYRALLSEVLYREGICRARLGRWESARDTLKKALTMTKDEELKRKIEGELAKLPKAPAGK